MLFMLSNFYYMLLPVYSRYVIANNIPENYTYSECGISWKDYFIKVSKCNKSKKVLQYNYCTVDFLEQNLTT